MLLQLLFLDLSLLWIKKNYPKQDNRSLSSNSQVLFNMQA